MENVLVCVTEQKSCDILIKLGKDFVEENGGELFIIHIAKKNFSKIFNSEEAKNLDYLYEKGLLYGANLTIIRSDDVKQTLLDVIDRNNIDKVILGSSRETHNEEGIRSFKRDINELAEIVEVDTNV